MTNPTPAPFDPAPVPTTTEAALAAGHSWRCDYARTPGDPDNECYCPTPEERAEQWRYDEAIAEGDVPEPYWVRAEELPKNQDRP